MDSPDAPLRIEHDDQPRRGRFFVTVDGQRQALMTYRRDDATSITVEHTEVDDALRGHGVARKLLDALVAWARATGTRVRATCPYARAQFEQDPSIADVYIA